MFYDNQPEKNKIQYKEMLSNIGQLSNLFSESNCPYLAYRAHENIFCKCFDAENLARFDCSADAKKENIGIGLKTWTGNNDQKVAEFGKLKRNYEGLSGEELVKKISQYRNERIRVTMNMYGLSSIIYHIVKRVPNVMHILECTFDYIDIDKIKIIKDKGNYNNTYFSDGKHTYHFSISKNTLYMIFDDMILMDSLNVDIIEDPFVILKELFYKKQVGNELDFSYENKFIDLAENDKIIKEKRQICLPLYSVRGKGEKCKKFVAEKSGLNQWNAGGRTRNENEIYIPYNAIDRNRDMFFFPQRDTAFDLHLPDGTTVSAKVCQVADKNNPKIGKAIMSNPNKVLGKWLLRDVFELPERTVVTYEMLEKFGVDSVVFTKNRELDYSVDFSEIGTYEKFYGLDDSDE